MNKSPLSVFAPAKINLYLHVTGRQEDGYHTLDSLVAFADIGDQIRLSPASEFSFAVQGPFASSFTAKERDSSPNSANLAVRAAWALAQALQKQPKFKITLTKNLPVASGLGGGSADAAAVIWALLEKWNVPRQSVPKIDHLLRDLGADVPLCFFCRPAQVAGVGDIIQPVTLPEMPVLLVNPVRFCSTAQVFGRFDAPYAQAPEKITETEDAEALLSLLSARRNMLEEAAIQIVPDIAVVLDLLKAQAGCRLARMSGSGATCFGLFSDAGAALEAAEALLVRYPRWWVRTGTLNRPIRY